ncbi:MAG: protein adenylyltransferase SelO family protein [Xanthomonadales bacterium]|nr:protein adenylyltransferase SelO family protein [Xanthomonadales bacterium]
MNRYARLPSRFYERRAPRPVREPRLVALNEPLAGELGLDPEALASPEGVEALAGNRPLAGSEPLAMAYAGHQFGVFVPSLGDGRALLLGELLDREGRGRELHMKGSGPTAFARGGDGLASLGPMVREFLACEAMAALGIPTTRALAVLATGEGVARMRGFEAGGILVRVARSHVRVGSFEYFAHRGDLEGLARLAEHAIAVLDPDLSGREDRVLRFYERVVGRSAELVADWMAVGFVHGVMNTDNTAVSGETLDYGPFGWVEAYDPATCYSSIDRHGRYAFGMQPTIAQWNLARLGECLVPLALADPGGGASARERGAGGLCGALRGRLPPPPARQARASRRGALGAARRGLPRAARRAARRPHPGLPAPLGARARAGGGGSRLPRALPRAGGGVGLAWAVASGARRAGERGWAEAGGDAERATPSSCCATISPSGRQGRRRSGSSSASSSGFASSSPGLSKNSRNTPRSPSRPDRRSG